MKLSRLLAEDAVLNGLEAESLAELIERALAELPDESLAGSTRKAVLASLLEREELGSIVANGAALPHARVAGLERPLLVVAVPARPLEVASLLDDDRTEQVHLALIILVAAGQNTLMLQTLAAVSKLLAGEHGASLAAIKSPSRFIRHVEETGIDVKKILVAADVMRTAPTIEERATLGEAVRAMIEARSDSIAVVDRAGKLLGEVGTAAILKVGVPSHLALLSDTSLLDTFEAFEGYFEQEKSLTVRELVSRDPVTAALDESIMAVAQKFLKSGKRKLYIVEEGRLRGEIRLYDMTVRVLGV